MAVLAEVQGLDMGAGGQHADDDVGRAGSVDGAGGDADAFGLDRVAGGLGQVKCLDRVAGFLQVDGHGAAHVADTDKCDVHDISLGADPEASPARLQGFMVWRIRTCPTPG